MLGKNNTNILLVALIGLLMMSLIFTINREFDSVINQSHLVSLKSVSGRYTIERLAEEFIQYKTEAFPMVEVYNKSFDLLVRMPFDGSEHESFKGTSMKQYTTLCETISHIKEGYTAITVNNSKEEIYFRWTKTPDGQDRLTVIYVPAHEYERMWAIPFICYIILLLIFILLIKLQLDSQRSDINRYHRSQNSLQRRIRSR